MFSVLHDAVCRLDRERVGRLLDQGADPDARDEDGVTVLHFAVIHGYGCHKEKRDDFYAIVTRLLESGADRLASDPEGECALSSAMALGDERLIGLLCNVSSGCDFEACLA